MFICFLYSLRTCLPACGCRRCAENIRKALSNNKLDGDIGTLAAGL
jgi:hypothetical protein